MRLYAASVDPPRQNSALVEQLRLPFPVLSDPEREGLVRPLGVADERDPREIARPAMVLVRPDGTEAWRFVSRDFADRLPEDDVVAHARDLGLDETTQAPPEIVDPEPGPRAMAVADLPVYFRGAKFAAQAMGLRHARHDESIKHDSKAYVAEMDRYMAAVKQLREG